MEGLSVLQICQHSDRFTPGHCQVTLPSHVRKRNDLPNFWCILAFFFKTGLELSYLEFSELLAVARELADL